jgi:hypothetical protein
LCHSQLARELNEFGKMLRRIGWKRREFRARQRAPLLVRLNLKADPDD